MKGPRTPAGGAGDREAVAQAARQGHDTASTPSVPLRHRRAAASWPQRHPVRIDRAFGVRDRWIDDHPDDWSNSEMESWHATADHLKVSGLFGSWQIPGNVRAAWYRRRSCRRCSCRGDAT